MTKHEAVEILEEVKTLDDSMFAYSQAYNDALDMAIEALKAQESCMDAVSREAVLDLAQTYGPATYDMPYGSGDMIIRPEDVETLPSVEPIPLARVMTWEEAQVNVNEGPFIIMELRDNTGTEIDYGVLVGDSYEMSEGSLLTVCDFGLLKDDYGKAFRCWTSRPTDKQREATPWN